ncbi:MarR family winged helix-turn-helix transcriptional regulator [Lichenifustis flavocetrariae]|uniref:MarR family transcriptional regulator n=1 Tax=Lichenifustis flavocetrariae TaxID=2949735 RepID=A0AA41Z089_9HYPH|nr:MarR family transcriptional regulator [Lichenifustis flavocetrariae]MCW6508153.1 MarR family transcriptional regulator [Lichenifustis flavocetrariae]
MPKTASSLEQRYCVALLQAARRWRRVADAAAITFDLSEATAFPLVMLSRLGDGIRQSTLAEVLGIEGPSLVRLLDQLGATGLVERREDASDKRAKTLHLTTRGRAVAAEIQAQLDATRAMVFAECRPEDLQAGLRVFAAIEKAAAAVAS